MSDVRLVTLTVICWVCVPDPEANLGHRGLAEARAGLAGICSNPEAHLCCTEEVWASDSKQADCLASLLVARSLIETEANSMNRTSK